MLLRKHNRETYANMVSLFASHQRVAVVQPTGTGKSYLIMQLIADNPDSRFAVCSPSTYIFGQMKEIADANGISLKNVTFMTYARLTQTELIDSFDYIVLDEFHRCGAEEWGRGVKELLDANPDARVFGTSATPIRYLDSGRNMADELFDSVYAVNMSLAEAIQRKILPMPVYVTSWYSFRGDIEQLEIKAEQSGNPRLKHALLGKIRKAKSMIAELDVGIEKIFEKHITNRAGKFIVFCPNVEQLGRMTEECDTWFTKVNHDIHKYTVYAQNSASDRQFEEFRNDKDKSALKLLFCIDMLNEGVHFDDVDGVIMLRATQSANVFYQQLGRALACSDSKNKPVIFDIVNNFETGDTAQQYAGFMEIARSENDYDNEIEFELYDYVRDIREILNELNDTFANSWDFNFELLKEYVEKNGSFPMLNTAYEGVSLGKWCNYQRVLNTQGKLSKTRIAKLNSIDFPWNVNEESWLTAYNEFARMTEKLGHFPSKAEMPEENKKYLFTWLNVQRTKYRDGVLDPERAEMLISLGCEMSLVAAVNWQTRFEQLKKFKEEHGRFPTNADAKQDELCKVLCTWINSQRGRYINGKITPEHKEKLDSIHFPWSRQDALWNRNLELVSEYYAENGTVPEVKTEREGLQIGRWLSKQMTFLANGKLTEERKQLLQNAGIPLINIRDVHRMETWLKYYNSYIAYLTSTGEHPNCSTREGTDLRRWRSVQLKKLREGKLSEEQVSKLKGICGDVESNMG